MSLLRSSGIFAASLIVVGAGWWISGRATSTIDSPPRTKPLFAAAVGSPTSVGDEPTAIGGGDFNGDGIMDIVTANQRSGDISVLLGKGDGSFMQAPGSPIATGRTTSLVAVGDVDDDGHADVAVGRHDSFEVILLLGDGKGGFRPAPGSPIRAMQGPKPHCHGLLLIDVNADRKLDLIATCADGGNVSILLGEGDGRFTAAPGSPFEAGKHPYGVAASDLNGDGKLDLAIPDLEGGTVNLLLGDGAGRFRISAALSVHPRPGFVGIGDIDGDGKRDVIVTHDDRASIVVLLGDGRGGFQPAPWSPIDSGRPGFGLAVADLDHNARADLILGHPRSNLVSVFLGDRVKGLVPARGSPFATGRDPNAALPADATGDGKLDLITANYVSGDVRVLPQD